MIAANYFSAVAEVQVSRCAYARWNTASDSKW